MIAFEPGNYLDISYTIIVLGKIILVRWFTLGLEIAATQAKFTWVY
ncbi:MAG: hypothetical protein AAFW70_22880 [Cyanobacteria bacterium J06635_10]